MKLESGGAFSSIYLDLINLSGSHTGTKTRVFQSATSSPANSTQSRTISPPRDFQDYIQFGEMQSLYGCIRLGRRHATSSSKFAHFNSVLRKPKSSIGDEVGYVECVGCAVGGSGSNSLFFPRLCKSISQSSLASIKPGDKTSLLKSYNSGGIHLVSLLRNGPKPGLVQQPRALQALSCRCISTTDNSADSAAQEATASVPGVPPRIKFKRLDKTARHIMQIIDKEAVEEVRNQREIPDIRPGYIIQLKVEVPENKRRVSTLKGVVIARRNAGLNTTFRLRRLVAGVGVESLFPLYSPNIKEIKVLDKKKVRRAKLYYLRDKMNALRK